VKLNILADPAMANPRDHPGFFKPERQIHRPVLFDLNELFGADNCWRSLGLPRRRGSGAKAAAMASYNTEGDLDCSGVG
jgi:hypothetical protein